jgi:hypothetical protein
MPQLADHNTEAVLCHALVGSTSAAIVPTVSESSFVLVLSAAKSAAASDGWDLPVVRPASNRQAILVG